jgi:transcription elongation factor GreA
MRVPIRKAANLPHVQVDHNITEAKYRTLERELKNITENLRPKTITEVKRLAEFGDFSENAAYALAKGRLRWLNQRILDLENEINHAVIIRPNKEKKTVQLGSSVTVAVAGKQKKYLVLGSAETNPGQGVISHHSPIGSVLMGCKVGDVVSFKLANKDVSCEIINIE